METKKTMKVEYFTLKAGEKKKATDFYPIKKECKSYSMGHAEKEIPFINLDLNGEISNFPFPWAGTPHILTVVADKYEKLCFENPHKKDIKIFIQGRT